MIIILICLLAVFQVTMVDYLVNNPHYYQLDSYTWETDDFRSMELGELIASQTTIDYDALTTLMLDHEYDLRDQKELSYENSRVLAQKPVEYRKLKNAYERILTDLKYFPIPLSSRSEIPDITYGDGWGDKRKYGGERPHEGCDLMGAGMERGTYPVVSISDGTVEKVGWLEKGGWRIGIRTPSGAYLYYAHLYQYSQEFKEGDKVTAGQLLGYMGDSGYSTVPGTVGNFDVHLHLGIYLKTDHFDELSVNPYWILRYLEKYRLKYTY
ncbi:MAG: M23 family metallopeptidase [Clostridiaceae bacterium]|nr:M23 family metallopeptidase [Clostridiaceae bacterium]